MKVVLASGNAHKLEEFRRILAPLGLEVLSQKEAGADIDVEETGTTFEENAYLKAKAIFDHTGLITVADDSGIAVDALGGEPGVYSARYAGEGATDDDKIAKVLRKLEGVPTEKRTARFVCAICCVLTEESHFTVSGVCEGLVAEHKVGDNGFGYDPIFMVGEKSFATMTAEEKDAVSHRGKASRMFIEELKKYLDIGDAPC